MVLLAKFFADIIDFIEKETGKEPQISIVTNKSTTKIVANPENCVPFPFCSSDRNPSFIAAFSRTGMPPWGP